MDAERFLERISYALELAIADGMISKEEAEELILYARKLFDFATYIARGPVQ